MFDFWGRSMKIGIISGHLLSHLIKDEELIEIETPYGAIQVKKTSLSNHNLFFINRHGVKSNIPPDRINYLGNIHALSCCHVDCIISYCTVGSLKKTIKTGDFVVPHDFIDFTKTRVHSFFDAGDPVFIWES